MSKFTRALVALYLLTAFASYGEGDEKERFFAAARSGDLGALEELIAQGVDIDTKSRYNATALTFACDKGQLEAVELLLAKGADINARDTFYQGTPIIWAANNGHADVVALLIEEGATDLANALGIAIQREKAAVVAALAASGKLGKGELAEALAFAEKQGAAEVSALLEGDPGEPWPAFRGANAAGIAQDGPAEWNAETGHHLSWKTPIPGRAHSSPIVWGGSVFLTTAVSEKPEEPFRHGLYGDVDSVDQGIAYSWHVMALDKASGEVLWTRQIHQGVPRARHHIKATQANATPATDGEHLVAILGSEGLYCFDLDGKLLWRQDLGLLDTGWFYDESYQWGHASSPIIDRDRVLVQVDRSKDSYLAAFALADGRELWRTSRDNLPSWGSPTLLEVDEHREIITNGSALVRAYDPADGKELWRLGPNSEVTVGTPVVAHGLVYLTGGYPPIKPIYAVRPGGRGDLTQSDKAAPNEAIAWRKKRGGTYMPTPIVYGDYLYTLANNGVLTCYEATTGDQIYRHRIGETGGAFSASPVAAGGKLYFASEDGDVFVIKAGPEYDLLATNPVGEVIMASPALSEGTLFVRSLSHLFAFAHRTGGSTRPASEPQAGGKPEASGKPIVP